MKSLSQKKNYLVNIILMTFCFIAMLIFIEIFLHYMHRKGYDSPLPYGIRNESAGRLGYVYMIPHYEGRNKYGILHRINSYGFRDDEINKDLEHILFLGDSTTFGLNLNHEDTFPEVLEKKIGAKGRRVQAINTASCGQGTLDQLDVLRRLLKDSALSIRCVVLGFYNNDFYDNMTYVNEYLPGYGNTLFSRFKKNIKSIEIVRYLTRRFQEFNHRLAIYISRERFKKDTDDNNVVFGKYVSINKDGRHGLINKYLKYVSGPARAIMWDLLDRDDLGRNKVFKTTINAIDEIINLCQNHNIKLVFLYLPSAKEEVLYSSKPQYKLLLEEHLSAFTNVDYIDMADVYIQYIRQAAILDKFSGHPGTLACRLIADSLEKYIN